MGKELYDGILQESNYQNSETIEFRVAELRNQLRGVESRDLTETARNKSSSISRAIFCLRKRHDTDGMANEISIGRDVDNDIIIADYSISKCHAKIIIKYNSYFIVDCHSTNLTYINDREIQSGVNIELPVDGEIAFGRVVFRFMSPEQLYLLLRKK